MGCGSSSPDTYLCFSQVVSEFSVSREDLQEEAGAVVW